MKITFEYQERVVTVEDPSVIDITDCFELVEKALLQLGYEPVRIKAAYQFLAQHAGEEL